MNYTLKSEEGGLWILGYLLTREGHDDINQRLKRGTLEYNGEGLSFFQKRKKKGHIDPLEEIIEDLVNESTQNEKDKSEAASMEEEETDDNIYEALQIAAFGEIRDP